eukprot:TRINITY_DN31244_c0_g1_i1.p1 TRINITY_DN31244_c0_g1~~TRINITY_DN31244_c0_g1_i1.p1  ORF type:complete len:353 (-),score=28.66 TRINITY_DN31244_c0_g1_i1:267-1325(-)
MSLEAPLSSFADDLCDAHVIDLIASFLVLANKRCLRVSSRCLKSALERFLVGHSELYLLGGKSWQGDPSLRVHRWDPRTRMWYCDDPELPMVRSGGMAAFLNGYLYICGGCDPTDRTSRGDTSMDRLDINTGKWESAPDMPRPRVAPATTVLQGRWYLCGGLNPLLASVDCFDPVSSTWAALPDMTTSRAIAVAEGLAGRLFVCGGFTQHGSTRDNLSSVECWEVDSSAWRSLPPMRERRSGACAAVLNGRLYVCGGENARTSLRSVECFDHHINAWETVAALAGPRFMGVAVAMAGCLYVGGGFIRLGAPFMDSIERFDPETERWETVFDTGPWPNLMGLAVATYKSRTYV